MFSNMKIYPLSENETTQVLVLLRKLWRDGNNENIKSIAKSLKNELACGGTDKNGIIELQGDHTKKIKDILVSLGFDRESID